MVYVLDVVVYAGQSNTNPDLLSAQFKAHGNITSAALPAATLTVQNSVGAYYFKHSGLGWHNFHYESIPVGFRGVVELYYNGALFTVLSINPQEYENPALGGGDNLVTVTVEDEDGNPVEDVTVSVLNSTQTDTVAWGYTDVNGEIVLYLPSESLKITARKGGYAPFTAITLTPGSESTKLLTLTKSSASAPPAAGLATVRTVVRNGSEELVSGAVLKAVLEGEINHATSGSLKSLQQLTDTSGADGVVELFLIQESQFTNGGTYIITLEDSSGTLLFKYRGTIPDKDTVELDTLIS